MKTIITSVAFALCLAPFAVQAQGIGQGAADGEAVGHRAAGPVGGAVGGVVGGVTGGVVGGVKGVLGIPQRSGYPGYRRHRRYDRGRYAR